MSEISDIDLEDAEIEALLSEDSSPPVQKSERERERERDHDNRVRSRYERERRMDASPDDRYQDVSLSDLGRKRGRESDRTPDQGRGRDRERGRGRDRDRRDYGFDRDDDRGYGYRARGERRERGRDRRDDRGRDRRDDRDRTPRGDSRGGYGDRSRGSGRTYDSNRPRVSLPNRTPGSNRVVRDKFRFAVEDVSTEGVPEWALPATNPHTLQTVENDGKMPPRHELSELQRSLAVDAPGQEYRRRHGMSKTALNWKQRKLLLAEIEFLTEVLTPNTPAIVLLIGSAPGHQIPILAEMFPCAAFELWDPSPYAGPMGSGRISCRRQCFTDAAAMVVRERLNDVESLPLFLISDIRTASPLEQITADTEDWVWADMLAQYRWLSQLRPEAALLKWRPPWPSVCRPEIKQQMEVVPGPKGEVMLPAFGPQTTTECRLFVRKRDADKKAREEAEAGAKVDTAAEEQETEVRVVDMKPSSIPPLVSSFPKVQRQELDAEAVYAKHKDVLPDMDQECLDRLAEDYGLVEYNSLEHERQMFQFNTVTRVSSYHHPLPVHECHSLDHCFDCASEYLILRRYSDRFLHVWDTSERKDEIVYVKDDLVGLEPDLIIKRSFTLPSLTSVDATQTQTAMGMSDAFVCLLSRAISRHLPGGMRLDTPASRPRLSRPSGKVSFRDKSHPSEIHSGRAVKRRPPGQVSPSK
ncbi:poxvirus/kinetoplastid-type cap-specific nucleoside 2-O-methyltransferase [Kipferlia bialata]|uniref:Cap-specific mRNA (nucleoside-2'-O-)-methyltransferase n=1 Tax=Kipferlia bialata TaxID=797122 RepID=A0A9K3CNK8_9EUKA|nr:poxvirus/kinetoplastid-type cap-specific nucleoside 2-O-methyltransferase [Kipferlia bialata]|eukprot:g532.t1